MKAVGIKVLKNKLSEYVHLAAAGETVLVTERDRVVAELVAPGTHRAESVHDSLLADAVRKGLVSAPTGEHLPLVWPKPLQSLAQTLKEIDSDRGER